MRGCFFSGATTQIVFFSFITLRPGIGKKDKFEDTKRSNQKPLGGYHTLQGDNSLKSVERFDHMMFVYRFQASR